MWDGDLTLRHHKRGLLTTTSDGPNHNGGEFMITFGEAAFLDGYQTVFGELVEGDQVLAEIERHVDRLGNVKGDLSIVAATPLWVSRLYDSFFFSVTDLTVEFFFACFFDSY